MQRRSNAALRLAQAGASFRTHLLWETEHRWRQTKCRKNTTQNTKQSTSAEIGYEKNTKSKNNGYKELKKYVTETLPLKHSYFIYIQFMHRIFSVSEVGIVSILLRGPGGAQSAHNVHSKSSPFLILLSSNSARIRNESPGRIRNE